MLNGTITKVTNNYIINKVKSQLSGRAAKKLSLASRITLIHLVLSTIPLYAMETTPLPTILCS